MTTKGDDRVNAKAGAKTGMYVFATVSAAVNTFAEQLRARTKIWVQIVPRLGDLSATREVARFRVRHPVTVIQVADDVEQRRWAGEGLPDVETVTQEVLRALAT